ncbi:SRPBCC domain-containing protein [Flavobacterium sp. SM15]|uniref:SRPBCC family protein n=1 Tax=Flavobacterium sp. SM15 TaxID=2908005 RepID=UPI001EDC8A17|nr:SRPBCC domain-containing protein [Flavobacterium sp. SM15]MCG2611541.1 SRPBCC domain-containing protein [Flavobacterium sp. SM15]
MATIYHDFTINATKERVFEAISTPEGLNNWWTLRCSGNPELNEEYNLYFAEQYNWFAKISKFIINEDIEYKITHAMAEWLPTSFGFKLKEIKPNVTYVEFYHSGWENVNQEFRIASYCWANLLRQMKQYLEEGIITPFEQRN